jgi:RNAse (barnase) inhibitor barstar
LNYFNYFTEIEQFYQARRESFTLLSTLDWVLIETWKDQGVPLDLVLKGIDRAFGRARRRINSLAYCMKAVEEVVEEQKETRVERPQPLQISVEETRRYLGDIANKVGAAGAIFPEFTTKIASIAESVRGLDAGNFRDAEQILSALEDRLVAILRVAAEESVLVEIQREVESELGPFRSTMTTEQLAMLDQQLARRKLLERYDVPRLSLFYLL